MDYLDLSQAFGQREERESERRVWTLQAFCKKRKNIYIVYIHILYKFSERYCVGYGYCSVEARMQPRQALCILVLSFPKAVKVRKLKTETEQYQVLEDDSVNS